MEVVQEIQVKPVATLETYGLEAGKRYTVDGRVQSNGKEILKGRTVVITGVSKKPGLVQGQLVHLKSGELQKCTITLPAENVNPYVEPVVEEAAPVAADEQAAV